MRIFRVPGLGHGERPLGLRGKERTGETLGGEVHLFFGMTGDGRGAVFVELERLWWGLVALHLGWREAQPAGAYAQGDLGGGDLDHGVLWGVEAVSGRV